MNTKEENGHPNPTMESKLGHSDRISEKHKSRIGNGSQVSDEDSSENGNGEHSQYIPSQIVSFVASSGTNTISHDSSGQPCARSSSGHEGITDSKKYRESQALYESEKEKESEYDPSSKKRKIQKNESVVDSETISSQESREKDDDIKIMEEISTSRESSSIENEAKQDKLNDISSHDSAHAYIPSEYGSCGQSGSVSTFTKSKISAEKSLTSSTDTPSTKGGISHDTNEK
jgi:hypothetical protein